MQTSQIFGSLKSQQPWSEITKPVGRAGGIGLRYLELSQECFASSARKDWDEDDVAFNFVVLS